MKHFNNKANTIILTLYLFLITYSFIFVFITDNTFLLWIIIPILLVLLWFVANFMLTYISNICIKAITTPPKRKSAIVFIITSLLAFLILMVWFTGYKPGSFQGDCLAQYYQATTGHYSDWHPVWQTFLIYTIPLKITGGAQWSMTFFQMIWFSLSMGYLSMQVFRCIGTKWTAVFFAYIMLNPYTGQMLLYPWKDCAFAIAGSIVMAMVMGIYFSKDKKTNSKFKCIILGFLTANCTIFRYNAVLYTAVLAVGLLLLIKFKDWMIIILSFILSFIVIQSLTYNFLDVESEPQTVVQSVGLPMTIIANVVKETPELLDPDTSDFVYKMADSEAWNNDYELGNFGVMKYYGDIDLSPIEEAGTLKVFQMSLKCLQNSPKASIKAFFALTDIVYGLDIKDEGYIGSQIIENEYGIVYHRSEKLANILMIYYKLVRLHGLNYFRQFAFIILALITVLLAKCNLRNASDWRKIGICLGIFSYTFGTMLLLTSADSRFFYIDYLVCPLAIFIMLSSKTTTEGNGD